MTKNSHEETCYANKYIYTYKGFRVEKKKILVTSLVYSWAHYKNCKPTNPKVSKQLASKLENHNKN